MPQPFRPAARSNGTRRPPLKSRGSSRGYIVADNRELVIESTLERRVLYCLLANRDIVEVRDQWPVLSYALPDGQRGTHTFDFWIRHTSGLRTAVAVRTSKRVQNEFRGEPSLAAVLEAICPSDLSRLADGYDIYTENDVSEADVDNARELLLSRKYFHEGDYQEALTYVAPICGTVRFHDLLKGAEVPAYRRMALWCLIDDGILFPVENGCVRDRTLMQVNRELIQGRVA